MKVTVLGCGGSSGVPLAGSTPGGDWGVCDPDNPKNRRRRVSVLVEEQGKAILIDTSPDLRLQLLDNNVTHVDAVLYTHAHADHSHGVDDLRTLRYRQGEPIDAYMDKKTQGLLTARFGYAFESSAGENSLYPPLCRDRLITGPFEVDGITVRPFEQLHGRDHSLGYRIGSMAYSTDASDLEEAAFEALEGVELWIVDCLRDRPHPTHSHFAQTLEWIERVRPKHAVLTHLNHQVDYEDLKSRCPPGVEPAYDGMVLKL